MNFETKSLGIKILLQMFGSLNNLLYLCKPKEKSPKLAKKRLVSK